MLQKLVKNFIICTTYLGKFTREEIIQSLTIQKSLMGDYSIAHVLLWESGKVAAISRKHFLQRRVSSARRILWETGPLCQKSHLYEDRFLKVLPLKGNPITFWLHKFNHNWTAFETSTGGSEIT